MWVQNRQKIRKSFNSIFIFSFHFLLPNNFNFYFYFAFWWRKSVISQLKCGLDNFFGLLLCVLNVQKNNNLKVWEELHVSELDEMFGQDSKEKTKGSHGTKQVKRRKDRAECGPLTPPPVRHPQLFADEGAFKLEARTSRHDSKQNFS